MNIRRNTARDIDPKLIEDEFPGNDPLVSQLRELSGQEIHFFPKPGNAGDAYITLCTFELFAEFNIRAVTHSMNDEVDNAVVVIGGGGNLIEGLYTEVETLVERLSRRNKMLIVLPHTVVGNRRLIGRTFENVILFCRDNESYVNALQNGSNPKATHLSHDITFFSNQSFLSDLRNTGEGSLTILRTDRESSGQFDLNANNIDISLSWNGDLWHSVDFCRTVTLSLAFYLSEYSEITTDRLHVALLAGQLNKKVTLLPNSYFKNEAVFSHSISRFLPNVEFSRCSTLYDRPNLAAESIAADENRGGFVPKTTTSVFPHSRVLEQWQPDRNFLREVLVRARNSKVVSLDVFDTSLTRGVDGPIDVFALVEDQLITHGHFYAKDFALARARAEGIARQKRFARDRTYEVDIFEIYSSLKELVDSRLHLDSVLLTELELEQRLLVPVPDTVELVSSLRSESLPFIFVTDTYLPAYFIRQLLDAHGLSGYTRLFVSSELRRNKASGDIWQDVQRFWHLPTVLHLGDNHVADVQRPREMGVETIEYVRAKSVSRHLPTIDVQRIPFSLHCRAHDLLERIEPTDNVLSNERDSWRQLGTKYGSLILGSFVAWLRERSRVNDIQSLYFLARDGHFALEAWRAAGFCESESIQVSYLPLSRRLVNVAEGIHCSSEGRLSQLLLNELLFPDGPITTIRSLQRSELIKEVPGLSRMIEETVPQPSSSVTTSDALLQLTELFQSLTYEIISALSYRAEQVQQYLIQEGLISSGRTGIVDIGWHGNIQASLTALLSRIEPSRSLHGFYMGLWPPASGKRAKAGPMEACFFSDFEDPSAVEIGTNSVAILEELNSAPHGSVDGLCRSSQGSLQPRYQDRSAELHQHIEKIAHFQAGALSMIRSIFQADHGAFLKSDELSPKLGRLTLEILVASPRWSELQLLSKLRHSAGSEHQEFVPLIHGNVPEDLSVARDVFDKSEYKMGQAMYWWREASEDQRTHILSVIRPWLESQVLFTERNLWSN